MDRLQTFENFLMNQSIQVDAISFTLNLALAALLAAILGVIYIRYGRALSNRRSFARNFVIMAVTTLFVITVVKSSLALSLGLVGALSIVRFRTAIKDPEELLYLFTTIAIGLGLGADQRIITLIAFAGIVFVLWLQAHFRSKGQDQNLYVTIESTSKHQQLHAIIQVLTEYCTCVDLKRFNESEKRLEATFLVEYENIDALEHCKEKLFDLDATTQVSFLDTKGMG